jgi:uncharacterized protein YwgA
MDINDFVLLSLSAIGGKIEGKTKLQKTIYFLGILTDSIVELGYDAHYYGPYSEEVNNAITYLMTIGVLEQSTCGGSTDPAGFSVIRYDFRLTESGQRMAESQKKKNLAFWDKISEAANKFQQMGNLNYIQLSIAAKTYFMLGKKRNRATNEELASLAPKFGWNVTPEEIYESAQYLKKLGLVEFSTN